MADPATPSDDTPESPVSERPTWIASRLQARFEGLDTNPHGVDSYFPPSGGGPIEPGAIRTTGVTQQGFMRAADKHAQRQIDDLSHQLDVLRDQLEAAFDEFDQRLEAAETRASVAEARASVAEARASVAETRATDAEARANAAHLRIDDALDAMGEDSQSGPAHLVPPPPARADAGADAPTLRSALSRLRDRLDVG